MDRSSHELLIPDQDFAFDTISEIELPLDQKLMASGTGEVTGGGIGFGWYRIEMTLTRPTEAFAVIRQLAAALDLPPTTRLRPIGATRAWPLDALVGDGDPPQESGG